MSKLTEQWIELFRAGNYGDKGEYSERDLDQIVANYDPRFHEAPAVIGHPENDLPAWGWVEAVKRVGDTLFGKLQQVQPAFEEMVKQGLFKKRSIGLYQTDKGLALRHVGFLGAQPPEIKGLADVQFKDNGTKFTEVDFEEEAQMAGEEKSLMDQLKAFFAGRESVVAAKTFSEDDVKKAVEAAVAPLTSQISTLAADVKKQETTFAEREQRLQLAEIGASAANKVAELKASGKWVPAFDAMGVPQFFGELAKSTATIEFSDGEKKTQVSLLDTAAKIFGALPQIVPLGTLFTGAKPSTARNFSENPNTRVAADPNSIKLNEAVKARRKEKNISFAEALTQVTAEHPELATPGGTSAGAV